MAEIVLTQMAQDLIKGFFENKNTSKFNEHEVRLQILQTIAQANPDITLEKALKVMEQQFKAYLR